MDENRILMSAEEVYTLLGIKESTLRKYAGILKKAGYHFAVNKNGQRGYYHRDLVALKKLIDIKEHPDMTLDQAAEAVMAWIHESGAAPATTPELPAADHSADRYGADITAIRDQLDKQNTIIAELIQRLELQQKHLDDRDRRAEERDRNLMQAIRASQENKQLLLDLKAAQDQVAAAQAKGAGTRIRDAIKRIFS